MGALFKPRLVDFCVLIEDLCINNQDGVDEADPQPMLFLTLAMRKTGHAEMGDE
jgi:hypothetical protein